MHSRCIGSDATCGQGVVVAPFLVVIIVVDDTELVVGQQYIVSDARSKRGRGWLKHGEAVHVVT